ncbi:hypothetical protein SAMN04488564_105451 [Lentzea waywayandensis]|uniref:Transcriptional regulator, AbiEi antitoxin, Type IV TA system n=1 Tax=Lentzea waywayandensis TaxID=84724 RepID=A0A1I6ETH1_9PSEU|nr:hypothetical protein [Lentzea waywayandensis]SFR21076.1 hypothetical protein SAMN04488564_105451 [Lentzea waywayandensis]
MRHPIDLEALGTLFVHRVAPVAALIHIGLSSSLIDQRSRPGGPWQRLFPSIFLLSRAGPSREQLVQAALLYAGEGAMLTAFDALYLHGMRSVLPTADAIHVLAPRHSRAWGHATLHLERTDRLPKPALRRGFHVAPLERAAVDAIRRTRSIPDTRAILDEVAHYVGIQALRAELALAPRKGTTLARTLLGDSPARQLELAVMDRRPPSVPQARTPLPVG